MELIMPQSNQHWDFAACNIYQELTTVLQLHGVQSRKMQKPLNEQILCVRHPAGCDFQYKKSQNMWATDLCSYDTMDYLSWCRQQLSLQYCLSYLLYTKLWGSQIPYGDRLSVEG